MSSAVLERGRPAVVDVEFASLTAGLVPHSFPSIDDVESVAGRLRNAFGMHRGAPVGGEHTQRLLISPGTVAIATGQTGRMDLVPDPDRVGAAAVRDAFETVAEVFGGEQLEDEDWRTRVRGAITEWSPGSRRRMVRTIAELDLSTWHEDGGNLAMLTLTLPGPWEVYAPTGSAWKRLIDTFRLRWVRETGLPWRCIWKLEFQDRGAPHQHMLTRVPAKVRDGELFESWLAKTWADVCLSSLTADDRARMIAEGHAARHVARGTDLSWSGVKFSDPRRTSIYFLKHAAPGSSGSKEYQHVVPQLWRAEGAGPGRFWGVYGLRTAVVAVELDQSTMHRARRLLRGVARGRAASTEISRLRADDPTDDGRLTRRGLGQMRRKRARSLTTSGGWVLVNDGLALALDLRRALQ